MTTGFAKWSLIVVLMALAFVFTQCGKPFADKGDLVYSVDGVLTPVAGVSAEDSLKAFQATVYPLTRQNCVGCHDSFQQPKHASPDPSEAHNAILQNYKVNFSDPANSRMVKKLKEENHHCWTSCAQSGQIMQDAIQDWADRIAGPADPPGGTGDFSLVTDASRTIQAERQAITSMANIITAQSGGAMLTAPMVYRTATQPYYVEVPNDGTNATLGSTDTTAGLARFTFSSTVARTGGALWGLVNATPGNDDSFFVGLNSAAQSTQWNLADTRGKFVWQRMPNNYSIVAGTNTFTLREREDGAQLAMILWTSDQALIPTGTGTAGQITLRFPLDKLLSNMPGATLEVKLEDYDSYSYRLTSLRLNNSSGRSVYVKNIRILVNGKYNPQHSNYTLVDQLVMNGGAALSPANMLVLKDQGEAVDKISFAFEVLEFR